MTVRYYTSSDAGAPALRGNTPGDLINLLTKCLVDGYGSKLGAGWSRPFLGTNVAAFKTGAGSNGMHLRVDDTSVSTNYRHATIVGYEVMTDVDTGSGRFPTEVQEPGGLRWFIHYGNSTASNARQWMLAADEKFMVFSVKTYPESLSAVYYRETYWFGDINTIGSADVYGTVLQGKPSNSSPNSSETFPFDSTDIGSYSSGIYIARSYTGLGQSIRVARIHDSSKSAQSEWGSESSYLAYPHGPDGAFLLSPVWIGESAGVNGGAIRGTLPGIWAPLQNVLNTGDTFDGQGDLAGRSFVALRQNRCRACIETSDTWR